MRYGEALLQLGHAEQARVIFRRAVLALPGNPYARLMLGESQLATGDGQGAWATLQPLAASTLAGPQVLEAAEQAARAVDAPEAAALQARLDPARLKETMALVGQGDPPSPGSAGPRRRNLRETADAR
ncbi:tetratricopeptide repeat protein [Novosphingobium resinovorum]